MVMTTKKKRFCQYKVSGLDGKASAIKAGYSENSAKTQASNLLSKDEIKDYIVELRKLDSTYPNSPPVAEDVSLAVLCKDPIEKLIQLMNCDDIYLQQSSAKALLPYFYLQKKDTATEQNLGKKQIKEANAIEATEVSRLATLNNQLKKELA